MQACVSGSRPDAGELCAVPEGLCALCCVCVCASLHPSVIGLSSSGSGTQGAVRTNSNQRLASAWLAFSRASCFPGPLDSVCHFCAPRADDLLSIFSV